MTMTVKCMIALWRSLVRNLHLYNTPNRNSSKSLRDDRSENERE